MLWFLFKQLESEMKKKKISKSMALNLAAYSTPRVNNANSAKYRVYSREIVLKALHILGWGEIESIYAVDEFTGSDSMKPKEILDRVLLKEKNHGV